MKSNIEFAGRDDPRFEIADTDRDGIPDLVVVFVRQGRFNVAVFHGDSSGWSPTPVWILRDVDEVIGGVLLQEGLIVPLYCSGCDSNPVFRWIGPEYVMNVHLVVQAVCVDSGAALYGEPSSDSVLLRPTAKVAEALVLGIGSPVGEHRWYKIKLVNEDGREGFIQSRSFLEDPGICE